MTNDKEVYGAGLARNIELAAKDQGLRSSPTTAIDKNAAELPLAGPKAKGAGADCFVYAGITANNAVQLYKDFAAALPNAKLYGAGRRRASPASSNPRTAASRRASPTRRQVHRRDAAPGPVPAGRPGSSSRTTPQKYGDDEPGSVRDLRLRGHAPRARRDQALRRRATKADVIKALFDTKDRQSVLGTYSIDKNGDTTLTDYGVYSVKDGELKFDKTIKAQAGWLSISEPVTTIGRERAISAPGRRRSDAAPHDSWKPPAFPARPRASQRDCASPLIGTYGLILVLLALPVVLTRSTTSSDDGNLVAPGQEPRRRPLQRRHLGAGGDRLHARLRHRRADQLRARRGLHDRLVHLGGALRVARAHRRHRPRSRSFFGLLLHAARRDARLGHAQRDDRAGRPTGRCEARRSSRR